MNTAAVAARGDYVLYWMIGARRTRWSHALDHAIARARELDRPLLVVEPLRAGYRWASDRLHAFVLGGMADNARAFAAAGVTYWPYVEPAPGEGRGLLAALARHACVVVTDEQPGFFLPRMVAAAGAALGVRVSVRDVFEATTVRSLIAATAGNSPQLPPLTALVPRPERVPLSHVQRRMWFVNQFDPASAAYNIPLPVRLRGRIDLDALRGAVIDTIGRHEVLRTRYLSDADGPYQHVVDAGMERRPRVVTDGIGPPADPGVPEDGTHGDVAAEAHDPDQRRADHRSSHCRNHDGCRSFQR